VFDPTVGRGLVTNWAMPEPEVDNHAIHLLAGESATADLHAATYLLVFGADDDRTELTLTLTMDQPPAPGGEQG
jgi:hypothetical protein